MKNMDERIKGEHLIELKSLIGKKLIKIRHDEFLGSNVVTQRIGLFASNGMFIVDNPLQGFDDYFWGPEDASVLDFMKINDESEMRIKGAMLRPIDTPVDETIEEIILVNDHMDVFNKGTKAYNWDSSEAIIFVTKSREYGFFRCEWLNEMVEVYKGHNLVSKMEPVGKHWDIVDGELSSVASRQILKLSETK